MSVLSRHTIGVIGSGTSEHDEYSRAVGEAIAESGANLLTGGGRGVMTSVSRAFTHYSGERGICIGIIPCASVADRVTPKAGYPNEFVELPIFTHLPYSGDLGMDDLSRNHINVLSCAAIIALPGGPGTVAEVKLAIRYGKPLLAYSPDARIVENFPKSVPRAGDIADLRRFIQAWTKDQEPRTSRLKPEPTEAPADTPIPSESSGRRCSGGYPVRPERLSPSSPSGRLVDTA